MFCLQLGEQQVQQVSPFLTLNIAPVAVGLAGSTIRLLAHWDPLWMGRSRSRSGGWRMRLDLSWSNASWCSLLTSVLLHEVNLSFAPFLVLMF